MPNIYWLAIDKQYCSYEELKQRKVVAQGWPQLGDLSQLAKTVINNEKNIFVSLIQKLGDKVLSDNEKWKSRKRKPSGVPRIFWNLFNLKKGDLVIALEGIKVRGICQLKTDSVNSYIYQDKFDYAQSFGYPVDWLDWNVDSAINPPSAPNQSVAGIAQVHNEKAYVIEHWKQVTNVNIFSYPEEIDPESEFFEGAKYTIQVNMYERNGDARDACLREHGFDCYICGFNFGKVYGQEAEGYIHVHHIVPISQIGKAYKVNPKTDLIPVCPNCHAVIHLSTKKPRSVDEMKKLIKKKIN